MRRVLGLTVLVVFVVAGRAAAAPVAPDLAPPSTQTDIFGPVRPLAALRPDVPWAVLTAGARGRVQKTSDGDRGPASTNERKASYDASGRLIKLESLDQGKLERTYTMAYDAAGRVTRRDEVYPGSGSIGPYRLLHTFSYDAAGRLAQVRKEGGGGDTTEMKLEYDAVGLLVRRVDGIGDKTATWNLERSKSGVLLGIVVDQVDGKKNPLYSGTADDKGRLTKMTSSYGETITLGYDAAGRESTRTTARGARTETVKLTYDAAGRPTKLEGEAKEAERTETWVHQATYDAQGHMVTSSLSKSSRGAHSFTESRNLTYTWDARGQLVAEKETAGGGDGAHGFNLEGEATYSYDSKGRLTELRSHERGYPPLDRTTTTTYSY